MKAMVAWLMGIHGLDLDIKCKMSAGQPKGFGGDSLAIPEDRIPKAPHGETPPKSMTGRLWAPRKGKFHPYGLSKKLDT